MQYLRQSTASQTIYLGPFVDSTDGVSIEDGLTINNTDIMISKNGGTMVAKNSNGATHDTDGWYYLTLDATDTATVGTLDVQVNVSGALQCWARFQVLEEAIYDGLCASGATALPTDVISISGDTDAADNLELMYDGTGYTDETAPASRSQVGNLSAGSSAISTTADSVTVTTGTPSGSYTDTFALDGAYHVITASGGNTDFYYEFTVGGSGVPTGFQFNGYAASKFATYTVEAYNWGDTEWNQIGTIDALNGTVDVELSFSATLSHVGTGANLGKVQIRFSSTDGTSIGVDRILCNYTVVAQSVGYANGSIWIDTNRANTNTESYVDGVADNPVSTWAAALTIAGNLGMHKFCILPGSSIALTGNSDNYCFTTQNSTIDLAGQSLSGAVFTGATIVGNDDGSNATTTVYNNCHMGTHTLGQHHLEHCHLDGTITLAEAGDYHWDDCSCGTTVPQVTFPAGDAELSVKHHSGSLQVNSMAAGDELEFAATGRLILDSSCTGGSALLWGVHTLVDNSSGMTISDASRIQTGNGGGGKLFTADIYSINEDATAVENLAASTLGIETGTATGGSSTTVTSTSFSEDTTDHWKNGMIVFTSGTLKGQRCEIKGSSYVGGTTTFTVTELTDTPTTETFVIV